MGERAALGGQQYPPRPFAVDHTLRAHGGRRILSGAPSQRRTEKQHRGHVASRQSASRAVTHCWVFDAASRRPSGPRHSVACRSPVSIQPRQSRAYCEGKLPSYTGPELSPCAINLALALSGLIRW